MKSWCGEAGGGGAALSLSRPSSREPGAPDRRGVTTFGLVSTGGAGLRAAVTEVVHLDRLAFMLLFFIACTGKPDDSAAADSGDTADTADSADTTDTLDSADSGDTADSGETGTDACPELVFSPDAVTFDRVPLGTTAALPVSILNNCIGSSALSVLATVDGPFTVEGSPLSLEPGGASTLTIRVTPDSAAPLVGTLLLTTNDADEGSVVLPLSATVDADADDDGYDIDTDCDDADPTVSPGAADEWYDGVDANCDGADDYDADADGYALANDCDDNDGSVYPGASDTWYDGVDSNCDDADDYDADVDGYTVDADCDDGDAAIHPGAMEYSGDGVDSNCDGLDVADVDGDGWDAPEDCDDSTAAIHPGAPDAWYDGVDANCDGADDYDADADGHAHDVDCNDADASVHPGAADPWYDGVDANCDGANDQDADGDGVEADVDCDDTDPTLAAASEEVRNGLDDDCDGHVDEALAAAGDLFVTEVFADPAAVSDTVGEWFELYNPTAADIDLYDWLVYSDDGGSFTVTDSVVVPAGGYVVLGVEDDTTLNGAVSVHYPYDRVSFGLGDSGDSIYLVAGSTTVAELSWTSGWPIASGASLALDKDHLTAGEASTLTFWCAGAEAWSDADLGTPGSINGDCALDDDRDGADYGHDDDCDDDNAAVRPGASETTNGVDDNCNGYVDELIASTLPALIGSGDAFLYAAATGDYDGDGDVEVAAYSNENSTWYLVSGPDYPTWSGVVTSYDEASFSPSSSYVEMTAPARGRGDVTGDGVDDLVYQGGGPYSGGMALYAGPITGTAANVVPYARFQESWYGGEWTVTIDADLDGDGMSELIYSNTLADRSAFGGAVAVFEAAALTGSVDYSDASLVLDGGTSYGMMGTDVAAGDANNDGYDDLVVASGADSDYLWLSDGLRSGGSASMPSVASVTLNGWSTERSVLHDADGDGAMDLILHSGDVFDVFLSIGSTAGTLTAADFTFTPVAGTGGMSAGITDAWLDSDGDGLAEPGLYTYPMTQSDLVVGFFPAAAFLDREVAESEAGWSFLSADFGGTRVLSDDLDGDGDVEIVTSAPQLRVLGYYTGGFSVVEP